MVNRLETNSRCFVNRLPLVEHGRSRSAQGNKWITFLDKNAFINFVNPDLNVKLFKRILLRYNIIEGTSNV